MFVFIVRIVSHGCGSVSQLGWAKAFMDVVGYEGKGSLEVSLVNAGGSHMETRKSELLA